MIINGKEEELVLEYPCNWGYRVMCLAHIEIGEIVTHVLKDRDFDHELGNKSKTGKYQSYNITILVHSDDDRRGLFELFKGHEHVAMVL